MVRILIFVLILLSFQAPQTVRAADNQYNGQPAIKVLQFNTGAWRPPGQWKILAEFAKKENIDVIFLQEQGFTVDISKTSEIVYIKQAFDEIYPMHSVNLEIKKVEGNVILSKYPYKENSYYFWQLRGNRFPQSVIVETPYGPLRVVNIHTHNAESCSNTRDIFNVLFDPKQKPYSPPGENVVIVGDYNISLKKDGSSVVVDRYCRGGTPDEVNAILSRIKTTCSNINSCTNINQDYIDLILSLQSSPLQIYQTWKVAIAGSWDHPPIVGLVGDPSWQRTTPAKPSDLDNDGDVDVFDYNALLGMFEKTGAPGFHPADINQNGAVDIFDYNELVKQL